MPWSAPRGSLRRRLAVALAGLSGLTVLALGGIYLVTERVIERTALRDEMQGEIRALLEYEARGEHVPLVSATLRYFPAGTAPGALAALPPGAFRRMRLDGAVVQVLTANDADGALHVLAHDLTHAEERERWLAISLAAGVALAAAGAWWASGRLSRRILNPLTGLVEQIRGIDPLSPARYPVRHTGDEEVDVIPAAVNSLIHELDHVLQRERVFADAASHELRTPLAVMRGAIDVLRERGDSPAPVVDRLDRAAHRAQEDLEALLSLSPAREPGAASPVELRSLLPAAAEPYLGEVPDPPRVLWEWDGNTDVVADPGALAVIFTNLLRNALRAAPGGEVRVLAGAARIRIVDDGEGLPDDWPERAEPRGRGLGLLIARMLAERRGWHLALERAEPRGTSATLHLGNRPGGAGHPDA